MDKQLVKALEASNLLRTHQNQKEQLKIKAKSNLIYSTKGGIFNIDQQLLMFVKTLLDSDFEEAVIPDKNFNPIKISDLDTFYDDILSKWSEVMNDYFVEYEKLKRSRTLKKVMELDDQDGKSQQKNG